MKIAIVGAGIVGSTAAYYLSKEKDVELLFLTMVLDKQPRQLRGSSVPGFLNAEIKLGIAWLVWELIFTKS